MKTLGTFILFALLLALGLARGGRAADGGDEPGAGTTAADTGPSSRPVTGERGDVRFGAVDVYLDSGEKPLAAYQFELTATSGDVTLAGLEGGDHPAFRPAPYYDPRALLNRRLVVAAFSTAADLPAGRTRVATLHVMVTGPVEPVYTVKLQAAAGADGSPVDARLSLVPASHAVPAPVSPASPAAPASEGALP